MKTTRKNFTIGLKYCKRNEQKIKDTLVAEIFLNENVSKFWKEVHSRTKLNKRCSDEIDGLKCFKYIASLFASKFKAVSGRTNVARDRQLHVGDQLPSRLCVKDVRNEVKQLNVGHGFDGIHSNHFKYASDSVICHLTAF